MRLYVAVTDNDWFDSLKRLKPEEVNFWTPSGRSFAALQIGEPLLFKLHSPRNYIAGGGFFAHFSRLPLELAWQTFGQKNGAASLDEMRVRVNKYRRRKQERGSGYYIGCILLSSPFFFEPGEWIDVPASFSRNIVSGKGYDMTSGDGQAIWQQVEQRLQARRENVAEQVAWRSTEVRQRLGQGTFRIVIADTYQRSCAVTGGKALPALEAAHIMPVSANGPHSVDNGVLLRSDIHRLFDAGYVTIDTDYRFRASNSLKEDFHNGEEYLALDRRMIRLPDDRDSWPSREYLEWHGDVMFRG